MSAPDRNMMRVHQQGVPMADERLFADDIALSQRADAAQLILGGRGSLYPGSEADYWLECFMNEPYFESGKNFEDYGPAYELGWTGYHAYGGEFHTADRVLANDWAIQKGISTLDWAQARPACRAAWQRAHNAKQFHTDGSASAESVIAALLELADNARDGELGFTEAAEHTESPGLVALFERSARSWRAAGEELRQELGRLGAQPEEGGTVTAAAHRVWLQIRSLLGGASDETLLLECERGEDSALARYREALQQNLPAEIHALVQRQFEATQRNRDMISTLLARARSEAAAGPGVAV
jgi:uncharacterized protein (TIGR02284 family)